MTYEVGEEPVPGYQLVTFVGRGNSGDVWKALGPGRVLVALKIIPLDSKLGRRERKAILGLRNFNDNALVNIYGLWFKDRDGKILEYSEELEDDASLPPTTKSRPGTASPTDATTSGSHAKLAAQPAPRVVVTPSPGYLGQTVDPDAIDSAGALSDTSERSRASSTTGSAESGTDTGSGTHAGSGSHGSDIAGSSSGTAGGTSGTDIDGSQPGGGKGKSSKSATELIVAMTLGDMTLGDRLEERQAEGHSGIPLKELQRLMRDAARGIDYLNCRHFQHCDIKPENILIVGSGAKICDFGLARPTKIDPLATQTPNGFTWACAAPEQLQRGKDVINFSDHTDQYSLATAYYRLRTGKFPFDENDISDLIRRKREGKLDLSSPTLTKRERVALAKALELEPSRRYPTAADFVEELERAHAPVANNSWRSFVVAVAAAMLLVIVPLGAWWAINSGASHEQSATYHEFVDFVNAGDFVNAKQAFTTLPNDFERRLGAELLLNNLREREKALTDNECKQLDQLIQDGGMIAETLKDRSEQSQVELVLTNLNYRRSLTIPSTVRTRLTALLEARDFAGIRQWLQELPSQSDCDLAVQAYVRQELILKWLAHGREQAASSKAPELLADLEALRQEIQTAERDDYNDDLDELHKKALQTARHKAMEFFTQGSDADWRAALQYWEAVRRYGDEARSERLDDALAWAIIQARLKRSQWPTEVQTELAAIANEHPLDTRPVRWRLLDALAQTQSLTSASPANELTKALDLAEALRRAPPPKPDQKLTAWEEEQSAALAMTLYDHISTLPSAAQAPLLARLEKLLPDSLAQRQLGKVRQLLAAGKFAEARPLLSQAESNFNGEDVKPQIAYLQVWCDLLDPSTKLNAVLPRMFAELRRVKATEWGPLCEPLVSRLKHADNAPADAEFAIAGLLAMHTEIATPSADLDRMLGRLLSWRLLTLGSSGENLPAIATDASRLWAMRKTLGTSGGETAGELPPWPIVASLWLEASQDKMPGVSPTEEPWQSVVAIAKEPLSQEQQQAYPAWASYAEWVRLVTTPAAMSGNAIDRLKSLYADVPADSAINSAARRGRAAEFVWASLDTTKLPSDAAIPAVMSPRELSEVMEKLQLATKLANGAKLSPSMAARLPATLAICGYYQLAAKPASTASVIAFAAPLLETAEQRAALEAHDGMPSLLRHLQYVRARAALSNKPATPSEAEKSQLLTYAAEGLTAAFDFLQSPTPQDAGAQDDQDLDLYVGLIEPLLPLPEAAPARELQAALATIYAAQARLIERSFNVQSRLGSQRVTVVDQFLLRRDSYARAAQWETEPPLIARNCLHHAYTLLDWLGSRDADVEIEVGKTINARQELRAIVTRAKEKSPQHHATLFLTGLQQLYQARDQTLDQCNIAASAAKQRTLLNDAKVSLDAALASTSLSPLEKSEYAPRYWVVISATNLERAFICPDIAERETILLNAREQAGNAIAAAQTHPRELYLDQAYLAEGNAYEDLALKCGLVKYYANSEASFANACEAAGSGQLQAEGKFNLGRCQHRLAVKGITVEDREAQLKKLAEAEESLKFARDNLPLIDKPQMKALAIEANLHLAAVHLEQADCYRAQNKLPEMTATISEADRAYARALAESRQNDPAMWAAYQETWLNRLLIRFNRQRAENAPSIGDTKTQIGRLANELLVATTDGVKVEHPVTAAQLATAVKALLDIEESRAVAGALPSLRVGRVPADWSPDLRSQIKTTLGAKQSILKQRLSLFKRSECDDMVLAAIDMLFQLLVECSVVPEFAEVRDFARLEIKEFAQRLNERDWKRIYAEGIADGYGGLELTYPLLFKTSLADRPNKQAEFRSAIQLLIKAIESIDGLAKLNADQVPQHIVAGAGKTKAFREALAKLMLVVNTFFPNSALTAGDKAMLARAEAILNQSLSMEELRDSRRDIVGAIAEIQKALK